MGNSQGISCCACLWGYSAGTQEEHWNRFTQKNNVHSCTPKSAFWTSPPQLEIACTSSQARSMLTRETGFLKQHCSDSVWHTLTFASSRRLLRSLGRIYVAALIPYPGAWRSGFAGVERAAVSSEPASLSLLTSIFHPWFFLTFRNLSQLVTVLRRSDHTSVLLASSCWSRQPQLQCLIF